MLQVINIWKTELIENIIRKPEQLCKNGNSYITVLVFFHFKFFKYTSEVV